jgi:hypothetical protein
MVEKIILGRQLFLLLIVIFNSMSPTNASTFNLQVGAFGNVASVGSIGVRVEIRMHIYKVGSPDQDDAFWVANNLDNGGGIQFGYDLLAAGTYCENGEAGGPSTCRSGSDTVNGSEPTWYWQYWPSWNGHHYYFGGGLFDSTVLNGTWHSYNIVPNSAAGWNFLLDGHVIANAGFPQARSSSPAYFTAEKITTSTTPGPLGPVEFRNLSYLQQDGWHAVTALRAIVNCGVNPNCIPIPYGVSLLGPNNVVAGTSIAQPKDGQLLWNSTAQSATTGAFVSTMPELFYGALAAGVVAVLIIIEFVVLPRRRRTLPQRPPDL